MQRKREPVPSHSVRDIRSSEITAAAGVLTRAFSGDPLFDYVFDDPEHYRKVAPWLFSTWIRLAKYCGQAWATPHLEAIALRRIPGKYHVPLWYTVRAGMLPTPLKLGLPAFRRLASLVQLLERKHDVMMKKTPHWYCQTIAVDPPHQAKGFGKTLMQHTFHLADTAGLPCYLETTTEKNVRIHQSQGYELRESITTPDGKLVLYLMTRAPKSWK